MAADITFRRFEAYDLPAYRAWFADPELSRRIAYPSDGWFAHCCHHAGSAGQAWVACARDGTMIAQIQVDREGARGYLALALHPDLRGQGLGRAVLAAFLSGPGRRYAVLEGRIEPNNAASLACSHVCGFSLLDEPDADGLIRAVRSARLAG